MNHTTLCNVSDLPAHARSAIEGIVGHALQSGEVLLIATLSPESHLSASERNGAWDEIEAMISQMRQHAARSCFSPNEIDEVIDSECAAVRYGGDPPRE
ncbi:MAG TPA: hypothetical protein VJ783_15995 [Pirellulales bacterium]|nr:hypothetical protein [Pirellulales bacterium]